MIHKVACSSKEMSELDNKYVLFEVKVGVKDA